jgi:hypothetical protein
MRPLKKVQRAWGVYWMFRNVGGHSRRSALGAAIGWWRAVSRQAA